MCKFRIKKKLICHTDGTRTVCGYKHGVQVS